MFLKGTSAFRLCLCGILHNFCTKSNKKCQLDPILCKCEIIGHENMEIYAQISVKTGCGVSSGIFPPFFTREQKWWFWHDRKQNHATPSKLCAQFWISPQSYLRIYFQIFYYLRPSFWWHIVENYACKQQTWKMKIQSWNIASWEGDTVRDVIFAGCFLSRRDAKPTRVKKNVVLNLSIVTLAAPNSCCR